MARLRLALAGLTAVVAMVAAVWLLRARNQERAPAPCSDRIYNSRHRPRCDAGGKLIPWLTDAAGPFHTIMQREAEWWRKAPMVDGWPAYLTTSQLRRNYTQAEGALPASTASMAIEAYLKYYAYTGDDAWLQMVRTIGDYVIERGLTPATYRAWPHFPWPAGATGDTTPDGGGHPNNTAGNVMPDKGAMVGISLLHLYEATGAVAYRDAAVRIANALADNAVAGTPEQSPWPFRVNGDSGAFVVGRVCGNQVFALRLFDELLRLGIRGNGKYQATRDNVWNWLKNVAIADRSGDQWQHFFEDHTGLVPNPGQFSALETARYLLEKKDALDPDWFRMAGSLIELVRRRWIVHSGNFTAIGEQQEHMEPYASHTARYASLLSKYHEAGGPSSYKDEAYHSFAYATYCVDIDGFANTGFRSRVAWTTDSFGDWMLHFMDGLAAVPEWAPGNADHLLRSSSVVQKVSYGVNEVSYVAFDPTGDEKLKLTFTPSKVEVDGSPISSWTWDGVRRVLTVHRSHGKSVTISPAPHAP